MRNSYPFGGWYVLRVQHDCAICRHLGTELSRTQNVLGLKTGHLELLAHAITRYDVGDRERAHILLPVCPEHAVEVYRGRVPGVEMAWQVA